MSSTDSASVFSILRSKGLHLKHHLRPLLELESGSNDPMAYVLVIAGMWFTISPYRLRHLIEWATASETHVKVGCAARLAFALFVVGLGFTAFRGM